MPSIIGNRIPAHFLGRPRETYEDRTAKRAEVIVLRDRSAAEAARLRAVA
jgi:hypothetical protein